MHKKGRWSSEKLTKAVELQSDRFKEHLEWLEEHMPPRFFDEVDSSEVMQVTHALMAFGEQEQFSRIHLKNSAIVLCLDSNDADLKILEHYKIRGIRNYRAFVSNAPPLGRYTTPLRIAMLHFTHFATGEAEESAEESLSPDYRREIHSILKSRNPEVSEEEFDKLIAGMDARFERAMPHERLIIALDMFQRAQTRDNCQYEIRKKEDWKEREAPSLQIVLAWKGVSKRSFLYRMGRVIHRHHLAMRRVTATYVDPYGPTPILIMSLGLNGQSGKAAWEEADLDDFLRELATLPYFEGYEELEEEFVESRLLSGNLGNFLKCAISFVHQALLHADPNLYSLANIQEAFLRHPQLTQMICRAFEEKFDPLRHNLATYEETRFQFLSLVEALDTGNEALDTRRKNVLKQALALVEYTLKTNFYRHNKSALSFRLDPAYLDALPYPRAERFPELPFAIFFFQGMDFVGFHIRFRDLSRGGLRTVFMPRAEQAASERNQLFAECYNLAYTQQKKNKDIPEGGAKGVIFMYPYQRLELEKEILTLEMEEGGISAEEIAKECETFQKQQRLEALYHAQRCYIESFLTLINCEPDGRLRAKDIVDYYRHPEYIYLGPDENMHNSMIEWITDYSTNCHYRPGSCFISSKPGAGINHKEFGVTSFGVNCYMEQALHFLGIDPKKEPFTIKISGGPDGDVAGNQILNLARFYPKTAKLLAVTDVSGTIFDPEGLDLTILSEMFQKEQPIRFYPPEKLSEGGFLLDLRTRREQTAYAQQTLLSRKKGGTVQQEWLSGSEMNHLFRTNLHQTPTDIFIPGGGRPRTLNESSYKEFLDGNGKPTSRAIVEGANLYLTPGARRLLEDLGVLIIKDSSANKGGVICSSFEVLAGLVLSEEEFIAKKEELMQQVLESIRSRALDEARLLLSTHQESGQRCTEISDIISERINSYMYEVLDHLTPQTLSYNLDEPLTRALLNYCPALLRRHYKERVIERVPDLHKKAIIACHIASRLVYDRGLSWHPTLADILPIVASDPSTGGSLLP